MGTAVAASATPAEGDRRMLTDPTGRTVQVAADPRRVVALAPSVTEIVYALGQEARLVGVTRHSNYPPAAQRLPQVGSYIQLDVERIVALRPDLCIAVKDGNPLAAVEQLEALGVAVFAINPVDLETVMHSVLAVGGLLGAEPQAQTVVGDMRRRIQKVRERVAQTSRRPTLFFQIGVSPIVSVGSSTFIHTLIELAGGVNVAAGKIPYPRFSREQVIGLAPEVIIISAMERTAQFEQVKAEWLQWPAIPAVKNQAVFIAPDDLFERPSPRLAEALEILAAFVHPELFKERP
jgi:iron complex transport system substrate-binding protein